MKRPQRAAPPAGATVLLYDWLLRAGMPGFYDKLLQVPLLNLSVKQDGFCEDGSGWACNELGILLTEHYGNRRRVAMEFERACGLAGTCGVQ